MSKLTKYELLEGINILFDTGYVDTRGLAQIDNCIYTKDDLDIFSNIISNSSLVLGSLGSFISIMSEAAI